MIDLRAGQLLRPIKKWIGLLLYKSKMAERCTTEQVLELLSDDFDASEGEESDFGDDEVCSYLPESCTEAGMIQSQDDSVTVEEVQLSPDDGKLVI